MNSVQPKSNAEILKAYHDYESRRRIINTRVGCILVVLLMPAGSTLDYFVYPDKLWPFFIVRLLCSAVAAMIFAFLFTKTGQKNSKWLGVVVPMLPAIFIAGMIADREGFASPYYAGLNLVLLAVGAVLQWTLLESVVAVSIVFLIYIGAGIVYGNIPSAGVLFNNFYFLILMDIIVVVGTYFQERYRFREFALRYELDKSRKALEASLQQLKENEMQLVQSEKLASLGRMSAGIIHEINNPLNFATTGLFTLRNKGKHLAPEQQADYAEILTDVEEGLKRVQTIVSDLRMFTHPNTEQLDPVPVAEVITPALRFLSNEWRNTVQIEQKLTEHQTIWSNKNKLIQVIVNILQNSLDAIKIKSFVPDEKPTIWIEGRVENEQSILSVRDNGGGIDAKHLDKIFDPFFTTKDVGEGMGLGLSISYSIVQEYGGKISVKSEPGKFCEFTLEFPLKTNQTLN
jgi:two-component system sensor histidine kinase PhcS